MEVALVGFMGTGKSTIGKLLADQLDLKFLETDNLIEKKEKMKIPEIFSGKGEKYFRNKENQILKMIINNEKDYIMSTGGGIVICRENRVLLKNNTITILLEASPETIYKRTAVEGERPLLDTAEPLTEIKKLMKERSNYYNQFSNKINTNDKTPEEIVNQAIKIIKEVTR